MDRPVNDSFISDIELLDLDPIKVKLMDSEEGEGWTREFVDRVEIMYRQFLILSGKHHGIVPTKLIDTFWHYHILDTMKYAEDCQNIFGYFMHHFPYFGMRGEKDKENLHTAFKNTQKLMEDEFGPGDHWMIQNTKSNAAKCGFCSTACSEGNCTPTPSCESVQSGTGLLAQPNIRPVLHK